MVDLFNVCFYYRCSLLVLVIGEPHVYRTVPFLVYSLSSSLAAQTQIQWVDSEGEEDSEEMGKPAVVSPSVVLLIVCGLTYCVALVLCRICRPRGDG